MHGLIIQQSVNNPSMADGVVIDNQEIHSSAVNRLGSYQQYLTILLLHALSSNAYINPLTAGLYEPVASQSLRNPMIFHLTVRNFGNRFYATAIAP